MRRGSGSAVTWRRAQMVLLSAQGMDVAMFAKVTFTSAERVRDVLRKPQCRRVRLAEAAPRRWATTEVRRHPARGDHEDCGGPAGRSRAAVLDLGLSKLADFLVTEGVVEDTHEGLRVLLREQGVSSPGRQDLEDQQRP